MVWPSLQTSREAAEQKPRRRGVARWISLSRCRFRLSAGREALYHPVPESSDPDFPMAPTLPRPHSLEIRQPLVPADTVRVDALDAAIILLPESALQKRWPEFAHSERLKKRLPTGKKMLPPTRVDLPNGRGTVAVVTTYKPDASAFELLTLSRKCVAKVREAQAAHLGLLLPDAPADLHLPLSDAVVSAVAASNFDPPQFKAEPDKPKHIESLTLFGAKQPMDFRRRLAEAEGTASPVG